MTTINCQAERHNTMLNHTMNDAEKYMQMALNMAKRGIGSVEPNPAVGAVIIKANQIIGKGWHKKFGEPHAEINALEDCKTLAVNPRGATMYVTLEPCSHEGKTGWCHSDKSTEWLKGESTDRLSGNTANDS